MLQIFPTGQSYKNIFSIKVLQMTHGYVKLANYEATHLITYQLHKMHTYEAKIFSYLVIL